MKKIIVIIIIFIISSTYSQVRNGTIEYELILHKDEKLEKGGLSAYYKDAVENAKYLTFELVFNNNEMFFYANEMLGIKENKPNFSLSFSGVTGKMHKDKLSDFVYIELKNNLFGKFILKKEIKVDWKIYKESKMIQNFKCYKATTIIKFNNGVGDFTRNITAWYCPSLPFSFGPKGYSGLPGLILELQENNVVFGAKKIKLNIDNFKFPSELKGKIITESEYKKIADENIKKLDNEK